MRCKITKGKRWVCVKGIIKPYDFHYSILLVYGIHSRSDIMGVWDELRNLKSSISCSLLVMGDFNEVLNSEERKGGLGCRGSMADFSNLIQDIGVIDLPLIGRKYT